MGVAGEGVAVDAAGNVYAAEGPASRPVVDGGSRGTPRRPGAEWAAGCVERFPSVGFESLRSAP